MLKASKAVAMGALFIASPITTGILTGVNALARRNADKNLRGAGRKAAFLACNAGMCLAAGAVSVAFGSIPVALAAAGVLTWVFGGDVKKREEPQETAGSPFPPSRDEVVVIDVTAEER